MVFTKGRQTSDATRRLINIIHHTNSTRTPSLLLSLDAEKAFNRVNLTHLSMVLQQCCFGGFILQAILALNTTPSARVYTSNLLSTPFHKRNGTRQGCPLSPLIFYLIMEPLAEHIRTNTKITGVTIGNHVHKMSLFADNVILMLTNPSHSLYEVQKILTWFGKVFYYKANATKSHLLDLGIDVVTCNLLQQQFPYMGRIQYTISRYPPHEVHKINFLT